jgi:hypothetical protein
MTSVRRPTGGGTDQLLGWDAFRYQENEVLAKSVERTDSEAGSWSIRPFTAL